MSMTEKFRKQHDDTLAISIKMYQAISSPEITKHRIRNHGLAGNFPIWLVVDLPL